MKSTKKSLFITTIAMVVLMVVALSTATFAWYTSSGTVYADTDTKITTATSSAANIAIGWEATATGTSVEFADAADLVPMVPDIQFVKGTTTFDQAKAAMKTGSLQKSGSSAKFVADGTAPVSLWTQSEREGSNKDLYLVNYNTSQAATVTFALNGPTKVGDANAPDVTGIFHLAVFAWDATAAEGAGALVYQGMLGADDVDYGTIKINEEELLTAGTIEKTAFTLTIPAATVTAGSSLQIALLAWIDGVELNNSLAGGAVTFGLTISA